MIRHIDAADAYADALLPMLRHAEAMLHISR